MLGSFFVVYNPGGAYYETVLWDITSVNNCIFPWREWIDIFAVFGDEIIIELCYNIKILEFRVEADCGENQ